MNIQKKLSGGDLRSIGNADEVVKEVLDDPKLFRKLFDCLYSEDSVVRMRSADAIEKITIKLPNLLNGYKTKLVEDISKIEQQEIQWHFAQIIPRVELNDNEVRSVAEVLENNLKNSKSNIVRVFSLQSLYDLSLSHSNLSPRVRELLNSLVNDKSAAMRSRVKKLKTL